jgi:hypothetical protein
MAGKGGSCQIAAEVSKSKEHSSPRSSSAATSGNGQRPTRHSQTDWGRDIGPSSAPPYRTKHGRAEWRTRICRIFSRKISLTNNFARRFVMAATVKIYKPGHYV